MSYSITLIYNEIIKDILWTGWEMVPNFILSSRLISDSNSFDFISRIINTKEPEFSADSDNLFHQDAYTYLINEQIDIERV